MSSSVALAKIKAMRPYGIYINQIVLDSAPHSGVQRNRVMQFIRSLAGNPNTSGDFFRTR
jgi:hypothetical protein